MTLPKLRLFRSTRFFAATAAGFLFAACISDGPTETGLAYIQSGGIQLSTPLYHLTLANFPVEDSNYYPTELPLSHFGEARLLVGRDGAFTAAFRMGFQITTQAQRDSIAHGLNLRLAGLPTTEIGYKFLSDSTAHHDTLALLVQSFAWNDTAGRFADSLPVFHRRMLASLTPFSTLDTQYLVRDTVRIALAKAYDSLRDTLQIDSLPHLRERIRKDSTHNWQVFIEGSPLKNSVQTGMYRFVGQGDATNNPGLLLGTYVKGGGNAPTLLSPYTSGGYPSVNYQVTHSGTGKTLLYGVSRGMNFRLNRDSLLNRIKTSLGAKYPNPSTGKYDENFFVPYAEIRLPLKDSLSRVDGPFALDMQLRSDVDSQAPGPSGIVVVPVSLNDSLKLVALQSSDYSTSQDSLVCRYFPQRMDTTLRQLVVYWVSAPTVQDTFLLTPDGKRQEIILRRHTGWLHTATLGVYPNASNAGVEVYFNVGSGIEPNGFIDPATQEPFTAFKDLSRRYWRPGAATLDVRATRGLGALLNRRTGVTSDLFLKPVDHNAYDTTVASNGTSYLQVSYPVLGEISFPHDVNGRMYITVDVYLYPLGSGK